MRAKQTDDVRVPTVIFAFKKNANFILYSTFRVVLLLLWLWLLLLFFTSFYFTFNPNELACVLFQKIMIVQVFRLFPSSIFCLLCYLLGFFLP